MVTAKGYRTLAGYIKAAAWGTPIAVGAGYGFEFNNESLTPDSQFIPDEQVSGERSQLEGDKGNEFHAGDINMDMKYEGVEEILAQAFGTAGVPVQEGGDDAYKHEFVIADELEGIFGSLAIYHKDFIVREYPTCKVNGFSFSVINGERAKITFPFIPDSLNLNTTTGVNTFTTAAAISLPTNRDFLKFSQMAVSLNAYDGADFAVGDLIYISEFSLEMNNNMATDDVTTKYGNTVDEPVCDGFSEITGNITFSKWQSVARINAMLSKARQKMKVVFTGPVADGAANFSLTWWMPNVQFVSGDNNIGGAGRVPENLQFKAQRALALPTGFPTGLTGALSCELVNQVATDPLA